MTRRKRYLTNDIFDNGRIEAGEFESSLIDENQDAQPPPAPRQRLQRRRHLTNLSHIDSFEAEEENQSQNQEPVEIQKTKMLRQRGQRVRDFIGPAIAGTPKSPNFSPLLASPSIRPVRGDPDLIAEIEETEDHSTKSNGKLYNDV